MNKSLRDNTGEKDKINDIRLSLNTPKGSQTIWVLVEGEDDCKIYPKFFETSQCKVEYINGGKERLSTAIKVLSQETNQVIGIQDADFLHLEEMAATALPLFYTDCHDIEMTMLSFEGVRNNLLTEYSLQDKQEVIWQNILSEAAYLGYIRWYNDINDNKIIFSGLGYGDIVTLTATEIHWSTSLLLDSLNRRSKNKLIALTEPLISSFISTHKTDDLLNLCNGHDTIALLSLIIGKETSSKRLPKDLRLSFTIQHFRQTRLYTLLQEWQEQTHFYILKTN
jgi:hypothetical protein